MMKNPHTDFDRFRSVGGGGKEGGREGGIGRWVWGVELRERGGGGGWMDGWMHACNTHASSYRGSSSSSSS